MLSLPITQSLQTGNNPHLCLQSCHHLHHLREDRTYSWGWKHEVLCPPQPLSTLGCSWAAPLVTPAAPQNFPWQHPRFSGAASGFLCWFLYFCQSQGDRNALSAHYLPLFSRGIEHFKLAGSLQGCYRREMSKNLPRLTPLSSGHTRNFLAGVKTPVASPNYHFHPCCASFKGVQGPHF